MKCVIALFCLVAVVLATPAEDLEKRGLGECSVDSDCTGVNQCCVNLLGICAGKRAEGEFCNFVHNHEGVILCAFMALMCAEKIIGTPVPINEEEEEAALDIIEKVNEGADVHLFESDIVLGIPDVADLSSEGITDEKDLHPGENEKRNAVRDRKNLWHEKTVPYTIDPELGDIVDNINEAMADFEKLSCIRFRAKQDSDKHWLDFVKKDGCWSSVGVEFWKEGGQDVSLGSGCSYKGTIMHEIMHALGFWHEQSRPDRNQYIEVFWENIADGEDYNFNKYTLNRIDYLDVEYDYESIMHYGRKTFSKNNKPTIQAIGDPDKTLGQRRGLSSKDIIQLNILYDCQSSVKGWSSWTQFGICSKGCTKLRQRFCYSSDRTLCPGVDQYGIEEDKQPCSDEECYAPVDGHWGKWSSWSACDKDCGFGTHTRTRECNDPSTQHGGKDCVGQNSQDESCKLKSCEMGLDDCEFDFDEWCHWQNVDSDSKDFDWRRRTGPTPTKGTGPPGDHTSGSGNYLYIEASSPAKTGYKADLYSKSFPPTEGRCIRWFYHMAGSSTGALTIYVKPDTQDRSQVWKKEGDQGEEWNKGEVLIASTEKWYKVIIEATRGSSFRSDIAIDDVKFIEGSCTGRKPEVNTTEPPPVKKEGCLNPLPLGMESGEIKDYQISSSSDVDEKFEDNMGRINEVSAWCASEEAADNYDMNQYLQINLGRTTLITGIATQGSPITGDYVSEYQLLYSNDAKKWEVYMENGENKVFSGNNESTSVIKNDLVKPVYAQFIRINPLGFEGFKICLRAEIYGCRATVCSSPSPLGLQSFDIQDSSITSTSTYDRAGYEASGARLHQPSVWCASAEASSSESKDQALEIDLGKHTIISGIATQGQPNFDNWVVTYHVLYSSDKVTWEKYKEDGVTKTFDGNTDRDTVNQHEFKTPFIARYIRVNPQSWNGYFTCLRAELYGCSIAECSTGSALGLESGHILDSQLSASSDNGRFNDVTLARLNNAKSWCASQSAADKNDQNQFIQISLREPMIIKALATQGQVRMDNWVTSYRLQFSDDAITWHKYQNGKVFVGNYDRNTVVMTDLDPPIVAQYVRVNPVTWDSDLICMRVELFGCSIEERFSPCGVSPRPLGMGTGSISDNQITASSESDSTHASTKARLGYTPGWCAAEQNDKQYLQIDLGLATMLTGISTRGGLANKVWVQEFHLDYSLDGEAWTRYTEKGTGNQVLDGNTDHLTVVKNTLNLPVFTRFLRINPKTWNGEKICLQTELYGCQPRAESVGCYRDRVITGARPLPVLLVNLRRFLDWKNLDLNKTIEQCKETAARYDYKFYGIEFWGECWVARSVSTPYYRYGTSKTCPSGVGKGFQIFVYQFT